MPDNTSTAPLSDIATYALVSSFNATLNRAGSDTTVLRRDAFHSVAACVDFLRQYWQRLDRAKRVEIQLAVAHVLHSSESRRRAAFLAGELEHWQDVIEWPLDF